MSRKTKSIVEGQYIRGTPLIKPCGLGLGELQTKQVNGVGQICNLFHAAFHADCKVPQEVLRPRALREPLRVDSQVRFLFGLHKADWRCRFEPGLAATID